jgi:hypothetical protein
MLPVLVTGMIVWRVALFISVLLLASSFALATSNYQYGPAEYVTVANGISPDGKYAITAHGSGELGYDNFHLYLTDAVTAKNTGPLEEIVDTLDTAAYAFSAKWSRDSKQVIVIYRVDRHAPLKAVSYRVTGRRARRIKGPFDVKNDELINYWQIHSSTTQPSTKIFGVPFKHK